MKVKLSFEGFKKKGGGVKKKTIHIPKKVKFSFLAIHTEPLSVNVSHADPDRSHRWASF